MLELCLRLVELIERDQGAPQRYARRRVIGMTLQAGAADVRRSRGIARAPELLGQLREGNRRRVLLDPTPEILDALVGGH